MITLKALGNCLIAAPAATLAPAHEVLFAAALFLTLERRKHVTRETLEALLWPNAGNADVHHRLRQTLLKLKKAGIPISREAGLLRIDTTVKVDFEEVLTADGKESFPEIPETCQLLPDYNPSFSTEFSHWLHQKRSEISAALSRIVLGHIRRAQKKTYWPEVEKLSRICLAIDPYNEEAVLARAESAALRGAKHEAVVVLDSYLNELSDLSPAMHGPARTMRKRVCDKQPDRPAPAETAFLGRTTTMQNLTSAFTAAAKGSGRALLLSAAHGMGKTRLMTELARFASLRGARVKTTHLRMTDLDRPLSAFIDLTPRLLNLRGAIGCSAETLERLRSLNSAAESGMTSQMSQFWTATRTVLPNIAFTHPGRRCRTVTLRRPT